jgi:hypothetical protein
MVCSGPRIVSLKGAANLSKNHGNFLTGSDGLPVTLRMAAIIPLPSLSRKPRK